jgi:hypothetical protein
MLVANYFPKMMAKAADYLAVVGQTRQSEAPDQGSLLD